MRQLVHERGFHGAGVDAAMAPGRRYFRSAGNPGPALLNEWRTHAEPDADGPGGH